MCILEGQNDEQSMKQLFCGFIKSFNSRRGFGFVTCEETAQRFGRDVYLSKDEAMMLADEPDVGLADASLTDGDQKKKPVPVQEGDFLLFQVKLSTEGFPQAVEAQKIRRLRGKVSHPASENENGIIIVTGEDSDRAESAPHTSGVALEQLLGAAVKFQQAACGQLQLLPNDEVAFCCVNNAHTNGQALEAQLVELLCTRRAAGSMLGCFSLKLPLKGAAEEASAAPKDCETVTVHGHAFTNVIVFPETPPEVGVPDLMRLFSKLGGTDPTVRGYGAFGHVTIAFAGPEVVAKFLIQATHTISESGITQLAHVGSCPEHSRASSCSTCDGISSTGSVSSGASLDYMQAAAPMQNMGGAMQRDCAQPLIASCTGPAAQIQSSTNLPCVPLQPLSMPLVTSPSPVADWRCSHGSIVVPASAPEIMASGENGCSLCIQWPTVVHASSYVVEILDLSTMTTQRFMRGVSESVLPALMDLRVDGLRSSACAACVRCVAPCGCEAAPSPWSYVTPFQPLAPPVGSTLLLPPPPQASGLGLMPQMCPPPPAAPPSLPLTTVQVPTVTLPAIPEEHGATGDMPANCTEECLTLD